MIAMNIDFYKKRIEVAEDKISRLKSLAVRHSWLRLIVFLALFVLFYFALMASIYLAIACSLLLLGLFVYLVVLQRRTKEKEDHLKRLREINANEIRFLKHDFSAFDDGSEFIDKEHPYSGDLDIFGPASLFQAVNRASSPEGRSQLSNLLGNKRTRQQILALQESVKELAGKTDWRHEMLAAGKAKKDHRLTSEEIRDWLTEKNGFLHKRKLKLLIDWLPPITFLLILLSIFVIPAGYLLIVLLLNYWINFSHLKKINQIHNKTSRQVDNLQSYSVLLKLIAEEAFQSKHLNELKKEIQSEGLPASRQLKRLSYLLYKLDYRLNMLFAIPLNLLFFWDLKQVFALEKWKTQHREPVLRWFDVLGKFEALNSLGNLHFNRPELVFPEISEDWFVFKAVEAGHPLIPAGQRVDNDFEMTGEGKMAIVTGSNMSGKTTFLRTIGINLVLAMAGGPVCARSLSCSPALILTSMRITDSLSENTSSFYAELKRLKFILDQARNGEKAVLLLDEILKGTNSRDRHTGSEALLRQLTQYRSVGLLATHNLELSKLEKEIPGKIENYNFDVRIDHGELYFDYKLHHGVCKSMNATILMKKIGIDINKQ